MVSNTSVWPASLMEMVSSMAVASAIWSANGSVLATCSFSTDSLSMDSLKVVSLVASVSLSLFNGAALSVLSLATSVSSKLSSWPIWFSVTSLACVISSVVLSPVSEVSLVVSVGFDWLLSVTSDEEASWDEVWSAGSSASALKITG